MNATEYQLKHILTPSKHTNSSNNWALLHTHKNVIDNADTLTYAVNHVITKFELPYTYIMGYNKFILNGTTLIVKTCNFKNTNTMVVVKTATGLPLHYNSWNTPNNLLYNKNNISGEFVIHSRNYTDGVIRHTLICMNSYLHMVKNNTYTTCISFPFLSYINKKNLKNELDMKSYTKYEVGYTNVTNFDSNCLPINNLSSSSTNKDILSSVQLLFTIIIFVML